MCTGHHICFTNRCSPVVSQWSFEVLNIIFKKSFSVIRSFSVTVLLYSSPENSPWIGHLGAVKLSTSVYLHVLWTVGGNQRIQKKAMRTDSNPNLRIELWGCNATHFNTMPAKKLYMKSLHELKILFCRFSWLCC